MAFEGHFFGILIENYCDLVVQSTKDIAVFSRLSSNHNADSRLHFFSSSNHGFNYMGILLGYSTFGWSKPCDEKWRIGQEFHQ